MQIVRNRWKRASSKAHPMVSELARNLERKFAWTGEEEKRNASRDDLSAWRIALPGGKRTGQGAIWGQQVRKMGIYTFRRI